MRTASSIALVLALVTGCAVDASDRLDPDRGSGGKADGEEALHVRAQTTVLGPNNVIRWPVAVDSTSNVDDVINAQLDFEAITGESLATIELEWANTADDALHQGVVAADFVVNAKARDVLSLTIEYETMSAFPALHHAYVNASTVTGAPVAITDLLEPSSLPSIAATLDARLQQQIASLRVEYAAEIASGEIDAALWDGLHVSVRDLESFSTTADGITFHWRSELPRALAALAPDGELAMTLDELAAHVRADGPWGER